MTLIQARSLFKQVEKNIFLNFKHLPRTIGKAVVEYEDLTLISCGFSTLSFNIVCDTDFKDNSYENMLERTDKFYKKTPYVWWLGRTTIPNGFNLYLGSWGFILLDTENAMICNLDKNLILSAISDLRIEQVTTLKHLKDFAKVLSAFENKIDTIYINELLVSKKFSKVSPLFVGYIDREPIATASLYFHDNIASLHDLATDEKFRNKGIGTIMTKYVMKYAADKNMNKICLTTNHKPSLSLYSKMGFETVGAFECYLSHENYR